jgi:acyl-CoA reductase-like NAD-dependent aldehyde dehydrogenase
MPVTQGIDYLRKHLRRWMRPQFRHVALQFRPARAEVIMQPLGVVGIVSPWNYPLALCLMPLATALAAGNRVMIKPSEYTPRTSALMASMLSGIFSADEVAVVTGGPDVGAAFSALPFDHLFFTGSTSVGKIIMRAASENLVPVTLELGGSRLSLSARTTLSRVPPRDSSTASSAMPARPALHPTMPSSPRGVSKHSWLLTGRKRARLIRRGRPIRDMHRSSASAITTVSWI